jgi:hypothetical protein
MPPKSLGRIDWMPRLGKWRVIVYRGLTDVKLDDYDTRDQAVKALQNYVSSKSKGASMEGIGESNITSFTGSYPGKKGTQKGVLPDGTRVRMKSGSQGWVEGEIVEYYDVIRVPSSEGGGYMYGGGMTPGYKVRVLQGKHKGEVLSLPMNYVEKVAGASAVTGGPGEWKVVNGKWVRS